MMHTIHKFLLELTGEQELLLTNNAQVLHVGEQNGKINLWIRLYTEHPKDRKQTFYIRGTGHPVPEDAVYLNTVHIDSFVWHVFMDSGIEK